MDEAIVKSLVERYQKPLFGFISSLTFSSREKAFEITVFSFVNAVRGSSSADESQFARALFRQAVEQCRGVAFTGTAASADPSLPRPIQEELRLLKEAMQLLPYEERCLLLLRDGQHLSYDDMSAILRQSPKEMRSAVLSAREALRKKMGELLNGSSAHA